MKSTYLNALELKNNSNNIPIWELEFHLWDKFNKGRLTVGKEFEQLSISNKEYALKENAETICRVCELLHFSAVTTPGGYWEIAPGEPAFFYLPGEYRFQQTALIKELIGDKVAIVANTGGVMAMPEGHEFVEFSIQMMTDPDSIDNIAKEKFNNSLQMIDRFGEIGVDAILTASDIADGHGLYFSPEQLDRYIYPYLNKWSEYVKSSGMKSILHTDGNINNALSQIATSGVNGLQALDSTANMNIVDVQSTYKDNLCVCGNIDCGLILTSTPEKIYEVTTNLLQETDNAQNFIIGASNALQYSTPIENYHALVMAVTDYSKKQTRNNEI